MTQPLVNKGAYTIHPMLYLELFSGVTLQAVLQTQIVSDSECLIFREMHASTKVMPCCLYCVTLCFVLLAPLAKRTGLSS